MAHFFIIDASGDSNNKLEERHMLKSLILTAVVVLGIVMPAASAIAEVDCSLLDPRASVSSERKAR